MNAGEDVLVFYNDNKASFQQFVEMMKNERDRQYQEDIQLLVAGDIRKTTDAVTQNQQHHLISQSTVDTINSEDSLQHEESVKATGLDYRDNNGHGALRFVNYYKIIYLVLNNIIMFSYRYHIELVKLLAYCTMGKNVYTEIKCHSLLPLDDIVAMVSHPDCISEACFLIYSSLL